MAKIAKLKKNGVTIYPATIGEAVIEPISNKKLDLKSVISLLNQVLVRTKIGNEFIINKYINGTTGNIDSISGCYVSTLINVSAYDEWNLSGRNSSDINNITKCGIIFYDKFGQKLKPVDAFGEAYQYYLLPYENGIVYRPENAVSCQISMFKMTLLDVNNVSFVPNGVILNAINNSDNYLSSLFFDNCNVIDGQVMVKNGRSYNGKTLRISVFDSIVDNLKRTEINPLPYQENSYIHGVTGIITSIAPIGGLVYRVSRLIPIGISSYYELIGRSSADIDNPTKGGIVFYDNAGNKLKPVDKDGVSYPYYFLPYENGCIFIPTGAVSFRFNIVFKALPETMDNVKLTFKPPELSITEDGVSYVGAVAQNISIPDGQLMIKYGNTFEGISISNITENIVEVNGEIPDGQLMIKYGNTFEGISLGDLEDYDGIFRIINYIASSVSKTQNLEFESVETNPTSVNPTIFFKDGELKVMIGSVIKKIQLID